ncbi:MAG: CocE/NonD family hydrolase, partial [Candidatus Lokiarchaeota archaeon]
MAYGFQTNFGSIDVQEIAITNSDGTKMVGKLYRPVGVDSAHPAPGILGIHGYNNDKDVQRGTSLELARAGFVVLAIDQIGHGDSGGALDAAFSTQIAGARTAYIWLARQPYVAGGMGVFGHSLGYISAFYFPLSGFPADVYAPNASIFETFPPSLQNFFVHRNVLHIWAEYEEFVTGMNAGLGYPNKGEVDTNYGDFSLGTAYREHYVKGSTHPGLTMDSSVNKESVAWMLQALKGYNYSDAWNAVAALGQAYLYTESFSGLALLFSFISVIFLAQILLTTKYFGNVKQPMPERIVTKKKLNWWIYATINTAMAGFVFVIFTDASNAWNFPTNAPILSMGMINNWLGFFFMSAAIAILLIGLWYHLSNKKERGMINPYDLGATYDSEVNLEYMEGKRYSWGKLTFYVGLIVLIFPIISQIFSSFDSYFVGWGDWLLIPWWGLWLIISSILVILGIVMLVTKLKEKMIWKTLGFLFLLVGGFFGWMWMHLLGYLWWAYWLFIPAFAIL